MKTTLKNLELERKIIITGPSGSYFGANSFPNEQNSFFENFEVINKNHIKLKCNCDQNEVNFYIKSKKQELLEKIQKQKEKFTGQSIADIFYSIEIDID